MKQSICTIVMMLWYSTTFSYINNTMLYHRMSYISSVDNNENIIFNAKQSPQVELAGDGNINGYEYVDLGLPSGLKWATCNIGASSLSDFGDYFAWGEITPKASYDERNCLTAQKNNLQLESEGIINSEGILTIPYDAAHANWGATWRIPTKEEFEELIDKCNWSWINCSGTTGYEVTGPNGKMIFMPAAGYRYGELLCYSDKFGAYWSATVFKGILKNAFYLDFFNNYRYVGSYTRFYGRSVRPVSE